MSLTDKNFINIEVNQPRASVSFTNLNKLCFLTENAGTGLSESNRTVEFLDLDSIGTYFGTNSTEYQQASAALSTSPNVTNAGGAIVFGFVATDGGGFPASPANLQGGEIADTAALVTSLQSISDGYMTYEDSGTEITLSGLDFTGIVDIYDAASIISTAIANQTSGAGSSFVLTNQNSTNSFYILSKEVGSTSTLTSVYDSLLGGTYIGTLLLLDSGSGASVFAGTDATPGSAEGVLDTMAAVRESTDASAFMFVSEVANNADKLSLAEYATANDIIIYDVFSNASNLETVVGNPVWDIKLAGYKNYRCLYSKSNNRRLGASYASLVHSVNFARQNSKKTMHGKLLSVSPESYTQDEIKKAQDVGLDIYTTVGKNGVPTTYTSGANGWTDAVYALIAIKNEVALAGTNLILSSNYIGQTEVGQAQVLAVLNKAARKFVRAGVVGAGTWTSPNTFGDIDVFERAIESNGYYFLADSLAEQSQVDRDARLSTTFYGAFKFTGAFHKLDIVLNFNN